MRKKGRNKGLIILAGVVVVLVAAYLGGMYYFSTHLLMGTHINDIDVSGKTPAQVDQEMEDYQLTVYETTAEGEQMETSFSGEQIGVGISEGTGVQEILEGQNRFAWFVPGKKEYQVEKLLSVDRGKLAQALESLQGFAEENNESDTEAYISDYIPGQGYEIVSQNKGNQLNWDLTLEKAEEAVLTMETKLDLAEAGCYTEAEEDEELVTLVDQLNTYVGASITYQFDDEIRVLDGDTIHEWLKVNKKNKVKLSQEKVEEFVGQLRREFDTIFTNRTFRTSYGKKVTIQGGDYGWWMNTGEEVKKLCQLIKKGKTVTRTPEYFQTAASYGKNDFGNSYVEVNLTAQHLFLYQDGEKVLESDFVSGNVSAGNGTPAGVYSITYKEEMSELVGENYATPVSYWMPFNGNIGLHDATWRSQFGASLYKGGGSHGCINLPYAVAKKIYSYVEKGGAVICYELPGTESSHITSQSDQEVAKAVIDSIRKIETDASRKRVQHSRAIYNRLSYAQRQLVTNYNKLVEAEQKMGL